MKKVLSVFLALTLVFTLVLPAVAEDAAYSVGDIIEYGGYPQTLVTDEEISFALEELDAEWFSYGYYAGDGNDGSMTRQDDMMLYTDVTLDGAKYRGVRINSYRPEWTTNATETAESDETYQYEYEYYAGNTYWFQWEPIKWRVLDPENGLVVSEMLLDSQPFTNTSYSSDQVDPDDNEDLYFNDEALTKYANDYATSSIRDFLIRDFYNFAFSEEERSRIAVTELDNSAYSTQYSKFDGETTCDKVFLLSYDDVLNQAYGFSGNYNNDDTARRSNGTDYAKAQGLIDAYLDSAYWLLRTPGNTSYYYCGVDHYGRVNSEQIDVDTSNGVRPAFRFDGGIVESVNPNGGDVQDHYYAVSVADGIEHGSAAADKTRAFAGETVKLTLTPDSGYALWSVYYYYTESSSFFMNRQYIFPDENGEYTFTMPDESVTFGAYFIPAAGTEYTVVVGRDVRLQNGAVVVSYNSTGEGSIVLTPEDVPARGVELKLWNNNPAGGVIHVVLMPDKGYDVAHSNIYDEAKNPLDGEWSDPEHMEGDIYLTDDIAGHLINVCPSYKMPRSVTVSDSIVGGTVTASPTTAYLYNDVALTATPDACHTFVSWDVKDSDGNSVEVGSDGKFTMPDSDVTVSATFKESHSYGEPVWTWSKSYHGASAAFACENCDDVQTVTAKVTEIPSPDATCTADGVMIHTATVEFAGETYTEAKNVPIPAKGHSYGEPTWSWATDGSSATATFTCSEGDDAQVITASGEMISSVIISEATADEEGLERFTATISFGGATFTDTFDKTIPVITPDDPTDPDKPSDGKNLCKYCGEDHGTSFWGKIVAFFHSILYFFAHLFGRM